jgi:acyl-CoA thioesterase II
MGDFEEQTRVFPREGRLAAELSRDWAVWGPNGGYLATIALRAAGTVSRLRRPASIAIHYLSVADFAEVTLDVVSLKATRRAESLRVSMNQGGKSVLEAMVWTVDANEGLEHRDESVPDVPPPQALASYEELLPRAPSVFSFWDNFERKPVEFRGAWPPDRRWPPLLREWYRLTPVDTFDDPFVDAGRALLMIDSLQWPSAAWHHAHRRQGFVAPTIDLSVHFHAQAPTEAWLLCVAKSPIAHQGLLAGDAAIWTRDGQLLASGTSHMLCRSVPPDTPGAA